MSENIQQIFVANPASSMQATDLLYLGRSTYDSTDDFAITFANFVASLGTATPTASTIPLWDANKNLSANNFLEAYTTTATAAGTTALTVASSYFQFFTGTTTQVVTLPVTSTLVLGQSFTIVNNSTGVVTVESSGGNTIVAMAAGTSLIVTCILTSGTTSASWNVIEYSSTSLVFPIAVSLGGTGVSSVTLAPTATAFAGWDANKNLSANNFIPGYQTIATAAGTTALTVASPRITQFTGITIQTVTMPVTSTLSVAQEFLIVNSSTGLVTVNSSGGNLIQTMAAGTSLLLYNNIITGTTAASWTVINYQISDSTYPLSLLLGGTNAALTASNGGIFYSTASAGAILSGTATAQQLLLSGSSTTPQWSTSTYPLTNAANTLLYASSANTMAALATANNGVLITSNTGVPSFLANSGTAGYVLTANSAAPPSWQLAAATSGLEFLGTVTASNQATVVFTTLTGYTNYLVYWNNLTPVTNAATLSLNVSTNGGSSYDSGSNYDYAYTSGTSGGATGGGASATTSIGLSALGIANTAGSGGSGKIEIINPAGTSRTGVIGHHAFLDSASVYGCVNVSGQYLSTTTVNAIQFSMSSGNISTGTFNLYGIK